MAYNELEVVDYPRVVKGQEEEHMGLKEIKLNTNFAPL